MARFDHETKVFRWTNGSQRRKKLPQQFDHTNAQQLLYKSARSEDMTSWLRTGYLDLDGDAVKQDEYKPDNLVVTVTKDTS